MSDHEHRYLLQLEDVGKDCTNIHHEHRYLLHFEDVGKDCTTIRFDIKKVEVLFESVGSGCLDPVVKIKDCETGNITYVSPEMLFDTKKACKTEARRQLNERIASCMSDINKTMLCVDEARRVLASII